MRAAALPSRPRWGGPFRLSVERLEDRTTVAENMGTVLAVSGVAGLAAARSALAAPPPQTSQLNTDSADIRLVTNTSSGADLPLREGRLPQWVTGARPAVDAAAPPSAARDQVFADFAAGGSGAGSQSALPDGPHGAAPGQASQPVGQVSNLPRLGHAAAPPNLAPAPPLPQSNLLASALAGLSAPLGPAHAPAARHPLHGARPSGDHGNPPRPAGPLAAQADPLYVYDANKGVTLPAGVPINDFSTWAVDLRAQVSGATVSSYTWDLSHAPDATAVSGQSSYRLRFTWASFTGLPRTNTITLTTTNIDGSHASQTLTFQVSATDSPAWSSTPPTTSSSWPSVLTPDALLGEPAVPAGPYAALGLAAGDVQAAHALPSYNPGVAPLDLVYDSAAADPQPVFLVHYALDPAQATAPPAVSAQLTFNGLPGATVYYNTLSLNPGDLVQLALQGNAAGLATGRYPWQISVTAYYPTPVTTTYSGQVDIINDAASPFGAGWTLANVERIWPVTGGVILEGAGGRSLWFANGGTAGTFVTPAGDFSTLTQNTTSGVYTRTLPDGTQINFNSSGLQTSVVDRVGNTTTFGYSGGRLSTITDMNSLVTTLAYSGGLVSSITDPAGRVTALGQNALGQLTSITDPDAGVWRYSYDARNDMLTLTDPRSALPAADTTLFTYDPSGRVRSAVQPDNTTLSLTPVQGQGLAAAGTGTPLRPAAAVLAAAAGAALTDPRGNVWTTGLDWLGFGTPTSQADPLGDTALTFRDPNGLPWLPADALGRRTRLFFDGKGNPTDVVRPDGTSDLATYNSFAEPTQITESQPPSGTQTPGSSVSVSYTYDPQGNPTQFSDPLSNKWNYTFTSKGSVASITDPAGSVTTFSYDSRNRLISEEDPLLNVTTYGYDNASDLTSLQNPLGFTSTFSYDPMDRLLQQTVPLTASTSAVTTLTYDPAGDLSSLRDPDGNLSTFSHDGMNRVTSSTDPLGHQSTYTFDPAGNLSSTTDRDGRQIDYSYDAADRLTGETWVGSSPAYSATFAYNPAGQLTSESDPFSAYQFTYDGEGRVASVSDSGTPGLPAVTLTYGYDAFDNRTSVSDSKGGGITYGYDNDFNLTSMQFAGKNGAAVAFTYDSLNRPSSLTRTIPGVLLDTISSSLTYDKDSRVTGITHTDTTQSLTLATFTYTYDGAGEGTGYTGFGGTLTYTYDRAGELTGVSGAHTESYSYDANGNRTMAGYSTGTGNELLSDGVYNYTYDNEGNLLTKTRISDGQVTNYTWDYHNRLTEVVVKTSGGTVLDDERFTYDVAGRRISVWANGSQQQYTLFDGQTPYIDFNGSGTLTERYLTAGVVPGGFLARMNASGTVNWYLTDNLGSVRQIVDTTGNVQDQLTYGSFGNILSESNAANGDRFKFASGQYDSSLGLTLFDARWEDVATGRFLSRDSFGFGAGDTNLYRYVENGPTDWMDPTGARVARLAFGQVPPPAAAGGGGGGIDWGAIGGAVEGSLVGIGVGIAVGLASGNPVGGIVGGALGGYNGLNHGYELGKGKGDFLQGADAAAQLSTIGEGAKGGFAGAIIGFGLNEQPPVRPPLPPQDSGPILVEIPPELWPPAPPTVVDPPGVTIVGP